MGDIRWRHHAHLSGPGCYTSKDQVFFICRDLQHHWIININGKQAEKYFGSADRAKIFAEDFLRRGKEHLDNFKPGGASCAGLVSAQQTVEIRNW